MSDELKDFINNNRGAFDKEEPGENLWKGIEDKLPTRNAGGKVRKLFFRWETAVAALLVVGLGYVISMFWWQDPFPLGQEVNLAKIDPQLAKIEQQYVVIIAEKRREVDKFDAQAPELQPQFDEELEYLDNIYKNLKKEMVRNPGSEEVTNALIENLQLRINLLEQQLQALQMIKNKKEKIHEDISI